MSKVKIADSAGFCFGVSRALEMTEAGIREGKKIVTYGPIIHNGQVVEALSKKGVRIIENVDEATKSDTVVIRSHGVTKEVEDAFRQKGIEYIDATCPFVKKIHKIVAENYKNGKTIVIIGDAHHPEVMGINGWCENSAVIFSSEEDIDTALLQGKECCVVSQTTFERNLWEKIVKIIKNTCKEVVFFDTICNATNDRQKSTAALARESDVFIVIGGRNSSNTKKLYQIAKELCKKTFLIEGAWELPEDVYHPGERIGITAGASTPDWIIKEVFTTMVNAENLKGELSFAEAFEESLVTLNTGQVVTGTVMKITPTEVYVNLGFKADGVIPVDELSDDPDVKPEDVVKVGEELEVFVVRVNDAEGYVKLSKKKIDAVKGWAAIENAAETQEVLTGKVIEAVNRGIVVTVNGTRVFVPSSQASERFVQDLSTLVGNTVSLRILNIKEDRRGKKAIGSIKSVLMEEKAKKSEAFWSAVEVGKHYTGTVKTLTSFGAFVDIGGVDGLVHISELSWTRIKSPEEVVKVGDVLDVYIIEANRETGKISLGYKKTEDNPWVIAQNTMAVGDVKSVKVVRLLPFGAFVEIIPGVEGLIHVSQIDTKRIGKPADVLSVGQVVEAKIVEADWEAKKIGLSIKALLQPEVPAEEAPAEEAPAEEAVEAPAEAE
ncbi:MAG: bifunctional 4-hydroxy-3-methylbut-2-enyl diphosphate reductase/30S ribosomal protein S1 [Clostridia bacterium]